MAPAGGRRPRDVQFPHELGKVGRRTGITIPDTGVRDENGLEPMDHLFSSPEKAAPANVHGKGATKNVADTTNSTEEDMDVVDSTIPDPLQVLNDRMRAKLLPPRSKSPRKTYLQSPARHNPAMGRGSSVDRMDSVVRQLNFTNDENFNSHSRRAATSPRQMLRAVGKSGSSKQANGIGSSNKLKRPYSFEEENEEDESINPVEGGAHHEDTDYAQEDNEMPAGDEDVLNENGDDYEANGMIQDDEQEVAEEAHEPVPEVAKASRRGRPAKYKAAETVAELPVEVAEEVRGKVRGRPAKSKPAVPVQTEEEEEVAAPANHNEDEAKHQRRKRQKLSPLAEQSKRGRGRRAADVPDLNAPKVIRTKNTKKVKAPKPVDSSPAQVIRQPPRPNTSGVLISRRENTNGVIQTRSGRHSFKPVATWRGEKIIYTESDIPDQKAGHYNTVAKQSIAEIIRIDEPEPQKKAGRGYRGRSRVDGTKSKKRRVESDDEEDDEAEPWESEPGRIVGDIRLWNPVDPTSASSEHVTEEIALSNAAIITRDIPGAAFKFAKTLTLPFFGSGMVDLPAGGIKKTKNSRKMHMCFFVFYGRVKVTVDENEFRIGKGGMWQVPRGNFYSIENDYDKPARIFFSQGCEIEQSIPEE